MLERTLMVIAAAAAIAAAAVVGVFALALALYALIEPFWGAAGAAAVVAGAAALVILAAGLVAARRASRGRQLAPAPEPGLGETVMAIVRKRPILSAGAAVGAGAFALLNPQLVAAILRAVMAKPGAKD